MSPLEGGEFAALLFNKGDKDELLRLTMEMLLLVSNDSAKIARFYSVRDLWTHEDSKQILSKNTFFEVLLPRHGSALVKLSPME